MQKERGLERSKVPEYHTNQLFADLCLKNNIAKHLRLYNERTLLVLTSFDEGGHKQESEA